MITSPVTDRLIELSPVDLYLSGGDNGVIDWPYRMRSSRDVHENLVNACDIFIMDSSIQDDAIGNREVIKAAQEYGTEVVVPADVEGDKDATVDAVINAFDIADEIGYGGKILIPLQRPYSECYRELEPYGDWFGVGGVKDVPATEKVEAARTVRRAAGDGVRLHAFGWGGTNQVIRTIRENPDLIDTMDSSAPVQDALTEMLPKTWDSAKRGSGITEVIAPIALSNMLEMLRRMNPELTVDPKEERTESAAEVDW
jgi:hypothetical protein